MISCEPHGDFKLKGGKKELRFEQNFVNLNL